MMLALNEFQFELLPDEASSDGVGFGIGLDISINDGGFDPGSADNVTQDGQNPTRGTAMFGRDTFTGPTWTWEMHTDQENVTSALSAKRTLESAWRARSIINEPGAVSILRYRVGGETRRVYGRPRRWAAPPSNLILGGYIPITADFKTVDELTYDDASDSIDLTFDVAASGGFVFPVVFPVTTLPSGNQSRSGVVGGDAITYPVIRFNGPVSNPAIDVVMGDGTNWELLVKQTLLAGEWVEVDTRPWKLTVLKNGTGSVAGSLGRRQYLEDCYLKPGLVTAAFRGTGSTGGATATMSWHNAREGY